MSTLRTIVPGSPALVSVAGRWAGPSDKLAVLTIPQGIPGDHLAPFIRAGYTQIHDEQTDDGLVVYLASRVGPGGFTPR